MKSWVEAANEPGCGFGLENLPFCAFVAEDGGSRIGVGIGDRVLDLRGVVRAGLVDGLPERVRSACGAATLNALMACGREAWRELRGALMALLAEEASGGVRETVGPMLRPMSGTRFVRPVDVGDYTDFYASIHHATNVGRIFRPEQPLLANYKWVPVGYHGRASSIVVSGTPVVRPNGQTKDVKDAAPVFGPTRQMDYEMELGVYVGVGNALGEPVDVEEAERRLFGVTLVNDWSARDVQAWEYQPLGPFLGKSFQTTVAPWVVTMEALEPYRVPLAARAEGDPEPLEYLASRHAERDGLDVQVEVWLATERMRAAGMSAVRLSAGSARDLYWSFAQMVAHHTSNGCNLQTGDLLASGTISGVERGSQGCLLERARRGENPVELPSGETRSFLEDGDEVTLRGFCERPGLPRIGLGECQGRVVPARLLSRR